MRNENFLMNFCFYVFLVEILLFSKADGIFFSKYLQIFHYYYLMFLNQMFQMLRGNIFAPRAVFKNILYLELVCWLGG